MNKKLIGIFVCVLLIAAALPTMVIGDGMENKTTKIDQIMEPSRKQTLEIPPVRSI